MAKVIVRPSQPEHSDSLFRPRRLFAAVLLPEKVRTRLFERAERVVAAFPAGRPRAVAAENLHLTLRFFGEEPAEGACECLREQWEFRFRDVAETLRKGAVTPQLSLPTVSASPAAHRPRLVWADAVAHPSHVRWLEAARQAAEAAALKAGFAPELRPFSPHVTLVRLRRSIRIPHAELGFLTADPWPNSFPVSKVALMESVLDPAGAIYRCITAFPLK